MITIIKCVLQCSGVLKCNVYPEWFEPFVRDWIDEITQKVRGEIVVLFDNEDMEASVKVCTNNITVSVLT